jgi:hypothetical protein
MLIIKELLINQMLVWRRGQSILQIHAAVNAANQTNAQNLLNLSNWAMSAVYGNNGETKLHGLILLLRMHKIEIIIWQWQHLKDLQQ